MSAKRKDRRHVWSLPSETRRKMKARIQDLRNALLSIMLASSESAVRKTASDAFGLDWQKDSDL